MEITINDCLRNLEEIIQKYKDKGGIDLKDSYFLFLDSGELEYSATILDKKDLNYAIRNNDLDETAQKRITVLDKRLYSLNGKFIESGHPDFFTKPLSFFERDALLEGWIFPHELNHLGFNKIIPHEDYVNEEDQSELIILTLIEGVAMTTSHEFCLSQESSRISKQCLETYSDERRLSGSIEKWGKTKDSELIACSQNGDTFFYSVGTNFIKKIIKPQERFASLLERIRDNYPTAEEILNPLKYLEREE